MILGQLRMGARSTTYAAQLEIFIIIIIITITCDLGKPHCTDKAGLRQIRPRNVLKWQIWGFWRTFFYQWDMCNVLIWRFPRHFYEREKRNGDDKIMLMRMRMMMVVVGVIVIIMTVILIMIKKNILHLSKKLPSQLSSVCEATLPRRRNRKKSICLARDTIWKKERDTNFVL